MRVWVAVTGLVLGSVLAPSSPCAAQSSSAVPAYGADDNGPSVLLSNAGGDNPYSSIGRFIGSGTCTAVFLATVEDDEDGRDAPAYVLTNGHCAAAFGSNEVLIDRPQQNYRVVFDYFADTPNRRELRSRRLAYSTMKGHDLAIIELDARYDDLRRAGYKAWRSPFHPPTTGEPVVVVGAPQRQNPQESFLRLAACQLGERAPVVLERQWHWFGSQRNTCTDIAGGSSGSPVISRLSGRLLGLVNTTTRGSEGTTDCFLNRPCEAVGAMSRVVPDTNYMSPLFGIDRCFDEAGRFNVFRGGCPLDGGVNIEADPSWLSAVNPDLPTTVVGAPRQQWNVKVTGPYDYYRTKSGTAGRVDCRDTQGYSAPQRATDTPIVAAELPRDEGHYFLCLSGVGPGPRGWAGQDLDAVTVVAVEIDKTPPRFEPQLTVRESATDWEVFVNYAPPEISLYTIKFGRPGETQCDDPAGYRVALLDFFRLPKANRPYTFCAIAYDDATNPSRPKELLFP